MIWNKKKEEETFYIRSSPWPHVPRTTYVRIYIKYRYIYCIQYLHTSTHTQTRSYCLNTCNISSVVRCLVYIRVYFLYPSFADENCFVNWKNYGRRLELALLPCSPRTFHVRLCCFGLIHKFRCVCVFFPSSSHLSLRANERAPTVGGGECASKRLALHIYLYRPKYSHKLYVISRIPERMCMQAVGGKEERATARKSKQQEEWKSSRGRERARVIAKVVKFYEAR